MLTIDNLKVATEDKLILNGLSLTVKPGEVHAIMGPNGAGKSTLAASIAGKPGYEVQSGSVCLGGVDLLELEAEERAALGLFLGFQYPVEIPGVNNTVFMKTAVNLQRKQQGLDPLDAVDFMQLLKEKLALLGMTDSFMKRSVNVGFSGGEKKRNEILQMLMLQPKLAVLDETDSGLDIDALQIVAKGVNSLRDENRSFILITHYQRLLDYIKPDYVHVLSNGAIVKSGTSDLALELEKKGYADLTTES